MCNNICRDYFLWRLEPRLEPRLERLEPRLERLERLDPPNPINFLILANRLLLSGRALDPGAAGALPAGAFGFGALPAGAFGFGAFPAGAFGFGAFAFGALPAGAFGFGALPAGALPAGAFGFGALSAGAFSDPEDITYLLLSNIFQRESRQFSLFKDFTAHAGSTISDHTMKYRKI
jgi:hypothetical protein